MDILKVVTADPFIHFVPLHVRSARVHFAMAVYAEIFKSLTRDACVYLAQGMLDLPRIISPAQKQKISDQSH